MRVKKTVAITVGINALFLLFSGLSGVSRVYGYEILSRALYYLGFAIPLVLFIILARRYALESGLPRIIPDREGALLTLPLIAPALLGVMALSFLTNLLLSLIGKSTVTELSGDLFLLILLHALLPAVLEELIFRYVPLTLVAPYSKKSALVLSALFFALAHVNLFKLPYALFAGVVYMWADVMTGSVLPSMALHFVNNVVAILWQTNIAEGGFAVWALLIIAAVAAVSLAVAFALRKRYVRRSDFLFNKTDKVDIPNSALLYVGAVGIITILSIF